MTHSLTLGSLLLTDSTPDDNHGYIFNVLADGVGFGVAAGAQEIVTSLLADGDLVRTTRYGNREVTFLVEITGPDLGSLAQGEAALRSEVGRGNSLTWQAPDVLSVPTVFDVLTSGMSQTFDDLDELRRRRTFSVTLTCAPFARSANAIVVPALAPPPITPSTVVVDLCSATTGWAAEPGDSLFIDSGSVRTTVPGGVAGNNTLTLTRAASIDVTAHPFLEIDWYASLSPAAVAGGTPVPAPIVTAAGVTLPEAARFYLSSSGGFSWFRSHHSVTQGQLNSGFSVKLTNLGADPGGGASLSIAEVRKSNVNPGASPRQITRVIETVGTERTPASIHVSSADGLLPLTDMVVHTCPEDGSGYSPPLRRYRTAGQSVTAAGTAFSGAYESITGAGVQYDTPTTALPEGGYVLAAYMRTPTPGLVSVAWSTSTIFPGGTVEEGFTNDITRFNFPDDGWHFVPLATLSLPSVRTKAGGVRTIIQVPTGPTVYLDEAWLFREDEDCALTIVRSSPRPNLWLDSADSASLVPTVWVGDGYSTRVHPGLGLIAQGNHVLTPGGTAVFTAALTDNPATEATFYPRWHSNAAS